MNEVNQVASTSVRSPSAIHPGRTAASQTGMLNAARRRTAELANAAGALDPKVVL